ncbi:hypothetical protein [Gelria sp. Kuro-4]|uniref:hypothetical protein n=1 Tax=Gelria sp. Kuro-4 TaxID=2796927 RepID=UPI001BEDEBF4|nr:hypothetical protein [Gelria sp. Kuro-4]BCV25975.1 hypothetical protein kuro4_27480 [Gelria sp. Kuro-4]
MSTWKSVRTYVLILGLALLLLSAGCAGGRKAPAEKEPAAPAPTAGVKVALVDAAGASSEVDLSRFPAVSAKGGYKKSTGTIVGPDGFTGVKVKDLLAQLKWDPATQAVQVVAADGYAMTFTADQVEGNLLTYNQDGSPAKLGGVEMILAYKTDGKEEKDLPRIVFVGGNAPLTDGHFWVKNVAKIALTQAPTEWKLNLSGVEKAELDRSTFESLATCTATPHPAVTYKHTDKEGKEHEYKGVPLWVVLSMVDGADSPGGHYVFNDDLAKQGYTVQVVAKDGFMAELSAQDVARNQNIILAYWKDGELLPPDEGPLALTGAGLKSNKERIKQVAEIRLTNLPK